MDNSIGRTSGHTQNFGNFRCRQEFLSLGRMGCHVIAFRHPNLLSGSRLRSRNPHDFIIIIQLLRENPLVSALLPFSKFYFGLEKVPYRRAISCAHSDRVFAGCCYAAFHLRARSIKMSWHTIRKSCITPGGGYSVFKVQVDGQRLCLSVRI